MSHPDPNAAPDLRPFRVGDRMDNPVTGEYCRVLELPWENAEGRARAELVAVPGARVAAEHQHPALTEHFTVKRGELTVLRDGERTVLRAGESAEVGPGVWHDWWNEGAEDAVVEVEITPGERFLWMIETLFGLGRLGHLRPDGMPHPLQLALIGREFSDVIVFRSPPAAVQRAVFAALGPVARARGYRATYPELSRSALAPRG